MGKKLSPDDLDLYNFIDEVLFSKWDPIGISDEPRARSEYQGYVPVVFSMIKNGKTVKEIANYLSEVESDRMGLPINESKNIEIAKLLSNFKKKS